MILALVKRNLKLYFRDRVSVFFSMLGVLLIVLVYVLFLGNMISSTASSFAPGVERFFTDSWIMAGVIASTSITTALAGFGVMVDDRAKKIHLDFQSAPIPRVKLVLAYILSAVIVSMIMTTFTLLLAEIYIIIYGGKLLSLGALLQVFGWITLSVATSCSIVFFLLIFVKSQNAFGTMSSLFGTLIGFITGIYVPIGNLPIGMQWVIKIFPISHTAAAIRQTMINEVVLLEYVPESTKNFMGITFEYGDTTMTLIGHFAVLAFTLTIFFVASVFIMKKHIEKTS